jgi:hypothetical protein
VACDASSSGGVFTIWTDTQLNIVAFGIRSDGSYQKLHDWWLNESGPIR